MFTEGARWHTADIPPTSSGDRPPARPPARANIIIIVYSLFPLILAFIPLVPGMNAIGGGTTLNGAIELGVDRGGGPPWRLNVPAPAVTAAYLRLPAVTIGGGFAMWAMLTTAWSPNPILTAGKSLEFGLIIVAAALVVRLSTGATGRPARRAVSATPLATALVLVILFLIAVNVLVWKTPLPIEIDGEDVLAYGEVDATAKRPRAVFAYAHPLLIGDMLAITIMYSIVRCAAGGEGFVLPAGPAGDLDDGLADLAPRDPAGPHVDGNQQAQKKRNPIINDLDDLLVAGPPGPGRGGGGRGTRVAMDPKTEKDIYTVNGRTELWQDVVLQIQDNWCIGIGFYGSRYVLMNIWPWAGHTHNSFLEVALGTGVVGLVICTLFVGHVARAIWRTRDGLLLGTATYCMIIGNTNPIIFYPCLQMFVLMVVLIGSSSQKPQRKTKERDKGNVHDRTGWCGPTWRSIPRSSPSRSQATPRRPALGRCADVTAENTLVASLCVNSSCNKLKIANHIQTCLDTFQFQS